MLRDLPSCLLALLLSHLQNVLAKHDLHARSNLVDVNGTTSLWLPQDEYSGSSFFDRWDFFTGDDPTQLTYPLSYTTRDDAFASGLAFTQPDGTVIMQGDNTTQLDKGVPRKSVRISSQAQYNGGLFILDLNKAPWGCGVWPAFWTVGSGNWPWAGEIDIIEGVHDNQHNQVAWHTAPGCTLATNGTFSGTLVNVNGKNHTDCNGLINDNAGCGIVEWSRASYGPYFDAQGGGVFAMKWDENGIAVWSFYRTAIPKDITDGVPHPDNWGPPSAALDPSQCDPLAFFKNHTIILNITFCGDWAGNSYTTSGCPGTCFERLQDPRNFVNATWIINSLKVYGKQNLNGLVSSANDPLVPAQGRLPFWTTLLTAPAALLL
ncbi:glycoside hydrolase family 16 protein [Macrolepiota fuliginosa MF-IS2]|uniref:Glycoside hydrolase family 16 protein n=1 Tax=Macrolepiota fuliginosa MF-IS2 TaxID=1400762 RepID=A0A9P5XN27_9AGAR|nr:glycoside hydrolase family 16 protein [Macrolepiota fuliginosa MF-IS2]